MVTLNSCPSASQVWDWECALHARLWYLGLAAVRVLCVDSFSTDISPCDGVIKSCLLAETDCVLQGTLERMPSPCSLNCFKIRRRKQCGAFCRQTPTVSSDSLAWGSAGEDSSEQTFGERLEKGRLS